MLYRHEDTLGECLELICFSVVTWARNVSFDVVLLLSVGVEPIGL